MRMAMIALIIVAIVAYALFYMQNEHKKKEIEYLKTIEMGSDAYGKLLKATREAEEVHEKTLKEHEAEVKELKSNNKELNQELKNIKEEIKKLKQENQVLKSKEKDIAKNKTIKKDSIKKSTNRHSPGKRFIGNFNATAYDLSVASCGKSPSDPGYGITASGRSIAGMSRETARTIAVDPNVIPLGSTVFLEFNAPYEHLNGNYTANDTGGAIKGNIVDVYMGVNETNAVKKFGRRKVKVYK